ncbi:MAG: hypothetical protein Q7K55_05615 [Candidatus Levybacteria bacterium]|nr:hypothetical protein [Candidatus Levybacteria bacterium]
MGKIKEKIITKKSFVVILILSFFTARIADFVDEVLNGTLLVGKSGFPFKDDTTTILGGGTFNNYMFALNVLFWFIVLFILWKLFQKTFKK